MLRSTPPAPLVLTAPRPLLLFLLLLLHRPGAPASEEKELRVRPYTDVTLPCTFSFVDGPDGLELSWERDDIREEFEVADEKEYFRFFRFYDFFEVFSKVVYRFGDGREQLEEQNGLYGGRVSVDPDDMAEGSLALLLRDVEAHDEAVYTCSASTPHGRGRRKIKLVVEEAEEPQVRFDRRGDGNVAVCLSKGWYHMPGVTWLNRAEEDISNFGSVEILEERKDGAHRVVTVLDYPVKLHETYVCRILETDANHQPIKSIRRIPKRKFHKMYDYY
ncbi:butyrophilin-like protein 10 [Ornithorhynchus anatinus]|uniref:butyrophilin-like protein 10 n=1 Tax=Ornithorhynchus anatinus TaxID=9258 RepID=UPI0010A8D136|nr:butyrophilin-like protein 10 [Ornithorhynchus anatinus]